MAASPAPAPKYSTYAPGKGPAGQSVKLAPGQTLAFQPGKGYYAKTALPNLPVVGTPPNAVVHPPPGGYVPPRSTPAAAGTGGTGTTPTPPPPPSPFAPLTQAQIDAEASAQAQSQLTPQEQAIQLQQKESNDQAAAQEAAITGFTSAAGQLEAGIAPAVASAYGQAATEQGQLGAGISGQVGADLTAAQKASADFAASEGQSGGETTSIPDVQNTIDMLQGVIPGSQTAAEGAAASTWAAEQPQIAIDAGREQLDARLAQARTDNDNYAQQLIQLAQTYPGLKQQALTQLNQYELDKANYRQTVTMNQNTLKNDAATRANNARALTDQEKAAGITTKEKLDELNTEYSYKYAALQFQSQKAAQAAAVAGKTINVGASRLLGHVVYKDGTSNPSIKVAKSAATTPAQKQQVASYKAQTTATEKASSLAVSMRGKPELAGKRPATYLPSQGHGKYIASAQSKAIPQGKPGAVFPDGTTNDLSRAAYTGSQYSYAQAQQLIYQQIGGDTLTSEYKVSKPQIMAWINNAMTAAGWRK